ncbi:hypothetical protein MKZ38_009654 [Zalerion maritima]|uniref:C2H2-type domain-containing protein n=1 Tax=Zalerion maritima TaxID=339359 RepID=A0AAD5WUL3_9PEZI|nr:hypothetical protein MKZ38_009654 [Zalerion maritima]
MGSKKRPFSGLIPDDFFSPSIAPDAAPDPDAASSGYRKSVSIHNTTSHTHLLHHCRASSPAPTGRFSLRRASIVTSSSASTFRSKSFEFKSFFSCVTRQTIPDDCARYRFIAWVAAKRNECHHMNEVDKLECPLLRCRKRFETHEELVKHIFDCEHLAAGEYWCFEHLRAERFDDGKCKGCCGHPTRRRKILSMARTFFSNLGHKSKSKKDLISGDNDPLFTCPPPSYESLHQELPAANEIFELPSPEPVSIPTISAPELAPGDQTLAVPTDFIQPSQVQTDGSQAPLLLVEEEDEEERGSGSSSRPPLQLNTLVGKHKPVRPPPAPRSKHLSPSSSVRSTASTNSTNSTISTTSSQSLVSPISAWSEASFPLGKSPSLTDPSNVLTADCFVADIGMSDNNDLPVADFATDFMGFEDVSELPGDQLQMNLFTDASMDLSSLALENVDNFENYTYNQQPATSASIGENTLFAPRAISYHDSITPAMAQPTAEGLFGCSNPRNLVDAAWATLGEQLSQSVGKLKDVENNPLAEQVKNFITRDVAEHGIEALELLLKHGKNPEDPTNAVCLAHLIYAFSVPVYEKHAMSRYKKLFRQSLVYAQDIPEEYRGYYREVVSVLWQPQDMSEKEVEEFVVWQQMQPSLSRRTSAKGKQPEQPADAARDTLGHPFVAVAQDFLDDLESAVVFNSAGPPTDTRASSDLRQLHAQAQSQARSQAPAQTSQQNFALPSRFVQCFDQIIDYLKKRFANMAGFYDILDSIRHNVRDGHIQSARKAEIEVLRAGKCCLDPSLFFDGFAPKVRHAANVLYNQQPNNPFPRSAFHLKDISVVRSIMQGLSDMSNTNVPTQVQDWFDDFLATEAPQQPQSQPTAIGHHNPNLVLGPATFSTAGTISSLGISHTSPSSPPGTSSFVPMTSPPSVDFNNNPFALTPPDPQHAGYSNHYTTEPPTARHASAQPQPSSPSQVKVESQEQCEICGYRPKGDPRWFQGSMSKHKKTKHSNEPDKIYKCPYPGCQSSYKNREDNLKQHMKEKNHYVTTDEDQSRRPSKRKKLS